MRDSSRRLKIALLGIALLSIATGVILGATAGPLSGNEPPCQRPGRILVIRGVLNVFSFGMDSLACKLSQRGYRVDVAPPSMAVVAAAAIQRDCRSDPSSGPLVIIGHSLGGRFCCSIPWKWRDAGMPVKLLVILDSNPQTAVADNVERCVNLYVTNSLGLFHGHDVWAVDPHTQLVNLDMTKVARPPGVPTVDHFTIDDSPWIHELVIEEVDRSMGNRSSRPLPLAQATGRPYVWREPNSVRAASHSVR